MISGSEERYTTLSELSSATGKSKPGLRKRANKEQWAYETIPHPGNPLAVYPLEALPEDISTAVICHRARSTETPSTADHQQQDAQHCHDTLWACYERASDTAKTTAQDRLKALQIGMAMIDNGISKSKAWNAVAKEMGTDRATVYRWLKQIKGVDRTDWLAALLPQRKGNTKGSECSPEAWDFFKTDWLRLEAPSVAECYQRLQRAAEEHGWIIPSQRTINRWSTERIPATVRIIKREGELSLMRRFPAIKRSVRELFATQWINGDGYQHNVFVRWPDGSIDRPKTWFWQDIHSRKILAYRVDKTENTDTIRLSFGDLVEQFGIPEHVTIDNTRAAANKWMTGGTPNRYRFKVKEDDPLGIFTLLGIQVHWTSVNQAGTQAKGHGQAKPIERAFGVGGLGDYVDKHPDFAGAYTGPNTQAKPENYGETAVPLDRFLATLNQEIIHWNAREGRRTEMAAGVRSFDQVFAESYANAPVQKATEAQRRLWLLAAEAITVAKDGTFTLAAGAQTGKGRDGRNRYFAPELQEFGEQRQKIVVRFDPEQLHEQVYAYTLDGRFIATADCLEALGFGDTIAGRAWNKARRQFIKSSKEAAQAEVRMDLAELSRALPRPDLPEPPESKVVRPVRPEIEPPKPKVIEQDQDMVRRSEAAMLRFQQQQEPEEVQATPESRYQRWLRLDATLAEGGEISDADAKWHHRYQDTAEFRSQKRMQESFGLAASAN